MQSCFDIYTDSNGITRAIMRKFGPDNPPARGVNTNRNDNPPRRGVNTNRNDNPPRRGVDINTIQNPPARGVDINTIHNPVVPNNQRSPKEELLRMFQDMLKSFSARKLKDNCSIDEDVPPQPEGSEELYIYSSLKKLLPSYQYDEFMCLVRPVFRCLSPSERADVSAIFKEWALLSPGQQLSFGQYAKLQRLIKILLIVLQELLDYISKNRVTKPLEAGYDDLLRVTLARILDIPFLEQEPLVNPHSPDELLNLISYILGLTCLYVYLIHASRGKEDIKEREKIETIKQMQIQL